MNKHCFKKVFSHHSGTLVAVGEQVRNRGKQPGEGGESVSGYGSGHGGVTIVSSLTGLSFALALASPSTAFAQALPTGGQVVGGSANIGQTGNTMTIDQSTQRAAINWNTFNIGADNTVRFNQPNPQSITLNRVVGGVPSNIQGSLLANGQVWIQNANGVLFGKNATINVNSLLATTKNVDVAQFMGGGSLDLTSTGKDAGIVNDGSITAQGYVTLVGDQARNNGAINAKQVTLAAGDSATVALDNGQGISVKLTGDSAHALAENTGNINAGADGSVLITAQGAKTVISSVINLDGVVRAGSVTADAKNGDITVAGKIDASNANADGSGGKISLTAMDGKLNAESTATLDASAGNNGNGGAIYVNSADTHFQGTARATGGTQSGDGGLIETSGEKLDITDAKIDASAANGQAGTWLLDPVDLTIDTPAANNISNALGGGTNVTLQTTATSATSSAGGGTTSTGDGNININAVIDWNAATTLTLNAWHDVNINAPITVRNSGGGVTINTRQDGVGTDFERSLNFGLSDTGFAGALNYTAGSGGHLSIDGITYTLVYSFADLRTRLSLSSAGNDILALASNLNASGTTYASPLRSSFGGTLEGLGHTINGLSINSADGRVGLFGDFMGIVRNLGLTNVSISGNSVRAGGLAGSNSGGSIINTYVSGTVNGEGIVGGLVGDNQLGGVIKNAYAYVSVNSSGNANITNVGGLVGYQADGLISDVHANVTVSGVVGGAGTAMANIGGLIGSQDGGSITNAHVAGKASGTELYSRIGGLVGYQGTGGSITASDADVSVSGGDNSSIGGLLGAQYGTIADAHASGAVNGGNDSSVGGLVGAVYLGSITNAYATGAVTRGNNGATGGLVGAQNDGILSNVHASGDVSGGDGGWIGGLIGSQFGTVTGAYATGTVSGGNGNIIGGLIGQQSGSVSNAYASGAVSTADNSWVGGLFGAVYYGGTSTDVHASGTVIGGDGSSVGGLIGWQEDGSVINAYATGAVSGGNGANIGGLVGYQNSGGSLANAHATGAVGGGNGSWIGGLVGVQYGSVSGSYATGTVSGGIGSTVGGLTGQNSGVLSNAYATGAVSVGSGGYAGGLIGEVYDGGTTTNVFATGAVRGGADADVGGLIGQLNDDGTVTNAYATGAVSISSGGYVGGLIGRLTTGTLTNTYFDTNTTGQAASNGVGKSANASGVTGRTTAQLQSGGTSIFNDPASWSGGVSGLYPYLTSFFPNGVQAVSGTAYVDSTETAAAASNASGAVTIRLDAHGNSLGQATTGANGYYYIFIPAGTLKQSDGLVVYGANAAGYAESATGASGVAAANLNLDGGWLTMKTGLSSLSSVNTGYAAAVANDGLYQPATAGITSERITATNATGFTIDNTATMTGNVEISAAGDLTIASGAQVLAGNDAILQTPGAFINNRGSDAVDAIGRWLIYSNNPDDNVFGNLNSGNTAIWNTAPGASVSANANRYVFAVPATISVTTTDDSKVYGDTTTAKGLANDYAIGGAAITGIAGAFVGDTSITISGAPTITSDGADAAATVAGGPYAINAAQGSLANSSGYAFTFANTGKLTVTPANLTVTPLAITGDTTSVTYNGTLQTNTFTPVGLLNSDTITSVDGLASGTNIGTYLDNLSNAQGTGLANYNITYANGSLTITPATLTITGDTSSKTYTASAQTNTFTTTGLRGSDTVTSVNGLGNGTNVGTYDDSLSGATGSGLTNYNINYVNGSLTITPASVTLTPLAITGDTTSVTYNGGLQTNTFASVGLLGTDAITGVDGLASGTNVGTYLDNLSNAQGTGLANYNITYANGSLTITPATLTITGDTSSKTYTATAQTNTFTTAGLRGSDTVTSVNGLGTGTNVGTYDDSLSGATGSGLTNYNINYVNGALTITPASVTVTPLTITGDTTSVTYNGGLQTNTFTSVGLLGTDAITSVDGLASGTNVGTYLDNLSNAQGTGLANYNITYANGSLTITPATLTITGDTSSKTYTATAQTNTFTTTGLRGSDTVTSVNGLGNGTNVGTYDDSLSGATGTGLSNYAINYVNSALTIDPARLTVTGDTKDSAYTAIAQTNTYTTNGLLGSDTVTGVTGLATGTDVGTYDDTLSNAQGTGLSNYAINYVNGALTITPAAPPPTPPAPASSGGRSGGGSGSGIAVAAVGAGIAGLIVAIETSPGGWALETPTTLTADTGAAAVGDATLDYVAINEAGTEATVRLHTDKGIIKRTLPLKDGGDGTKHFGISDPNTGEYAELSFKHTTREYFYQESGALNGQAYAVKAHGWLRAGAA